MHCASAWFVALWLAAFVGAQNPTPKGDPATPFVVRVVAGKPAEFVAAGKVAAFQITDVPEADRPLLQQLLEALEKRRIDGVEFACTTQAKDGRLKIVGAPVMTHRGRLHLLEATQGKGLPDLVPAHPLLLATEAAMNVPDPQFRVSLLCEIATLHLQESKALGRDPAKNALATKAFELAVAASEKIPATGPRDAGRRPEAQFDIAARLASNGFSAKALALIESVQAPKLPDDAPSFDLTWHRQSYCQHIVDLLTRHGKIDEAQDFAKLVNEPRIKTEVEWAMAAGYAFHGDDREAEKRLATTIGNAEDRYAARMKVGNSLNWGGRKANARGHYRKAADAIAEMEKDPKLAKKTDRFREDLARGFLSIGDSDSALRLMHARKKADDPSFQAFAESFLGEIHVARGDFEKAREHGILGRDLLKPKLKGNEYPLFLIVEKYAKLKQYDKARKAMEDLEDEVYQFKAVCAIAKAQHAEGKTIDAQATLRECVDRLHKLPDNPFPSTRHSTVRCGWSEHLAELQGNIDEPAVRHWINNVFGPEQQAWSWIGLASAWNDRLTPRTP
jgi:tetratricopeptide (TPR) repeat protein